MFYDDFNYFDCHGIGFDFFKMVSILENGILSEKTAQAKGIDIKRRFGGYNESSSVSIALLRSEAYNIFVKDSISFLFSGNNLKYARDPKEFMEEPIEKNEINYENKIYNNKPYGVASGIFGERFVKDEIPRENIKGIMLPEDKISEPIDSIDIIGAAAPKYFDNIAIDIIDKIHETFGIDKRQEIRKMIEEKNLSKDPKSIEKEIRKKISNYFATGIMKKYNLTKCPSLYITVGLLSKCKIDIYLTDGRKIFSAEQAAKGNIKL